MKEPVLRGLSFRKLSTDPSNIAQPAPYGVRECVGLAAPEQQNLHDGGETDLIKKLNLGNIRSYIIGDSGLNLKRYHVNGKRRGVQIARMGKTFGVPPNHRSNIASFWGDTG